jgi:hypothetical protein
MEHMSHELSGKKIMYMFFQTVKATHKLDFCGRHIYRIVGSMLESICCKRMQQMIQGIPLEFLSLVFRRTYPTLQRWCRKGYLEHYAYYSNAQCSVV